jgi:release factor glutamine methyltransferase
MMEERWTVLGVLQWTAAYFGRKHIEQPRASAEVLLAHVLNMERIQLYLNFDRPLAPEELASYREVIRRRAAREPTQYITGKQEFWSLELEVTPAVLIPRPETELLVEKALTLVDASAKRVLDLGTGSGAIALALAHECPTLRVVASDQSYAALQVARRNAHRHQLQKRISFVAADLLGGFSPVPPPFDIIVSNPPYIGEKEFPSLAPEIIQYEPNTALRAGPQGLAVIRRIIGEAPGYLRSEGSLLLEIGAGQAELLHQELQGVPGFDHFEFIRDYSGILRVLHLQKALCA